MNAVVRGRAAGAAASPPGRGARRLLAGVLAFAALAAGCMKATPTPPSRPPEPPGEAAPPSPTPAAAIPAQPPRRPVLRDLDVLIQEATDLTITAADVPGFSVSPDPFRRAELVALVRGMTDTSSPQLRGLPVRRYPDYVLDLRWRGWVLSLHWDAPDTMTMRTGEPDADQPGGVRWLGWKHIWSFDDAVWKAVSALAPVPDPDPSQLDHLLLAERAEVVVDGRPVAPDPIRTHPLVLARLIRRAACAPAAGPAPADPAPAVIRFVVRDQVRPVQVWERHIAYAGRVYACPAGRPGILEHLPRPPAP